LDRPLPSPTSAMWVRRGAQRSTRAAAGLLARQSGSGGSGAVGLDLADQRAGPHLPARARHRRGIRRCDPNRGHLRRRHPSGQFDLIRGRISILGTRLDLTEGLRHAAGRFRPVPAPRAESRAGGYRIIISVEGPPPPPTSRSVPTRSCRRTRSSPSFSSGAPSRPCRRSSCCNWPMPRARWPAAAQWRAPVQPARGSRPRRSGPADRRRGQRRRPRRALPVGQCLHRRDRRRGGRKRALAQHRPDAGHHRARQFFLGWQQRHRRVFRTRLLGHRGTCLLTRPRPRDISRIHDTCPGGGIGRRAGFRCQWPQGRGGSSPLLGTSFLLAYRPSGYLRPGCEDPAPASRPDDWPNRAQGKGTASLTNHLYQRDLPDDLDLGPSSPSIARRWA
jgi:hypothetical protein